MIRRSSQCPVQPHRHLGGERRHAPHRADAAGQDQGGQLHVAVVGGGAGEGGQGDGEHRTAEADQDLEGDRSAGAPLVGGERGAHHGADGPGPPSEPVAGEKVVDGGSSHADSRSGSGPSL